MKTTTNAGCAGKRKQTGSKRKLLSEADVERLAAGIDPLLLDVFRVIGEEKAVPEDLFPLLLGVSPADIASVLADGVSRTLLKHERFIFYDRDGGFPEPPWYYMTQAGLRVAGLRHSYYYRPTEYERKHARGVIKARLWLEAEWPKRKWLSERGVIEQFGRTSSRSPLERNHIVDGALRCGNGKLIGVEYERTGKDPGRLAQNMEMVVARFGGGYYFCSEETRARVEHIKRAKGFRTVQVFPEPTFPGIV